MTATKNTWNDENRKTVSCRVSKEEAEAFAKTAAVLGVAPNVILKTFVRRMTENVMKPDEAAKDVLNRVTTNKVDRKNCEALMKENEALRETVAVYKEQAAKLEALVDKWLRSADGK